MIVIKHNELPGFLLMLIFSFLMGSALAFFLTASMSAFLEIFGDRIHYLSYSYFISGLLSLVLWYVFNKFQQKVAFSKLLIVSLAGLIILTVLLIYLNTLYNRKADPTLNEITVFFTYTCTTIYFFYRGVSFWSLAGRIYDVEQANRLFGILGNGEVLASLAGFMLVPTILSNADTGSGIVLLIWVAFGFLLLSLFSLFFLSRRESEKLASVPVNKVRSKYKDSNRKDRYFSMVLIFSALPILSYYFVDFIFLNSTDIENIPKVFKSGNGNPGVEIAKFIGYFFAIIAGIELLVKTFFFQWFMKNFGVKVGLSLLPASLILFSILGVLITILSPDVKLVFIVILLLKLVERVVFGAIHIPGFQIMYQPIPESEKTLLQTRAQGLPVTIAMFFSGITLLASTHFGNNNPVFLFLPFIVILIIWLFYNPRLFDGYKEKLKNRLDSYADTSDKNKDQFSGLDRLKKVIKEMVPNRLKHSISMINLINPYLLSEYLPVLTKSKDPEIVNLVQSNLDEKYYPYQTDRDIDRETKLEMVSEAFSQPWVLQSLRESSKKQKMGGLFYSREFFHSEILDEVLTYFQNPVYTNICQDTLEAYGEKVIRPMENLYNQTKSIRVKKKSIQVLSKLHHSQAIHIILDKLKYGGKGIQKASVDALLRSDFEAKTSEEQESILSAVKEVARKIVWLNISLIDIKNLRWSAALEQAIKLEINENYKLMADLLGCLYGQGLVQMIRENLKESSPQQAKLFALEVAKNYFEDNIKGIVFPLLENLVYERSDSLVHQTFPQTKMSGLERLEDIINSDFTNTSLWLKSCALIALGENIRTVPRILKAFLFHAHPLIYETVAQVFVKNSPEEFKYYLSKLKKSKQKHLVKLYLEKGKGNINTYKRIVLLKEVPLFQCLGEVDLVDFAMILNPRNLKENESMENDSGKLGALILIRGHLSVNLQNKTSMELTAGQVLIEEMDTDQPISSIMAIRSSVIFYCKKDEFLNHVVDYIEITDALLDQLENKG